ncbi:MAG TPA: tetratricopeptide repeat protein [Polyangiaceae bacterium]|nr:tetratricopeptide repeat protein [Polyangiaceae bacterium]
MFKVECPACRAPYQVDERRVPPGGLKMRCPKCGTSFQVEPPPADPRGTSPAPVLGAALGVGDADSSLPPAARPPLPKKKPAVRGTMIGVAPPLKPPAPAPAPPAPAAPAATSLGEADLELDLPAPRVASPAQDPFADLDLPVAAPPKPAAAAPKPAAQKPLVPRPAQQEEADLPSPVGPPKPGPPRRGIPSRPQPAAPASTKPALPRPAELEAELPALVGGGDPFGEIDLPAPAGAPSPAARSADAGLPAVPTPLDLPSPRKAPVAAPKPAAPRPQAAAPVPARAPARPSGARELDLPSPAGGADLPASFDLDLPSPSLGADLPSPAGGVGLPSLSEPNLPAVGRGGGGFGEIDLPIVSADLPSPGGAGLPSPSMAGLPSPAAAGLPMTAAGLPVPAVDDPFGSGHDAPPFAGTATRPLGSLPPDPFGAAPDPFGDGAPPDPFGEPAQRPSGGFGEPAQRPSGGFGAPPSFEDAPADPFSAGAPAPGPDDDAGGEFAPPQEADVPQEIERKGGGGTAYGEVNLDDAGAGVAIEGDVPERAAAPEAPRQAVGGVARQRADAAAGGAVAEIQAKRRRKRLRVAVVSIAVAVLAGGSLTLVPALGPFGAYFILDQVRRGEYERLLAGAESSSRHALGSDTYPDADKALAVVSEAQGRALRYKPLAAYRAFIGFEKTLRFGAEPQVYARAKVALEELADAKADKMDLALAARAAVDGELARGRELLTALSQRSPRDVDVAVVRGELELRAKDPKAALAAWTTANGLEKSARTLFGLARSQIAAGDGDAASRTAGDVLAANPNHIGAKLLLAEVTWQSKHDEAAATKLLDDVIKNFALAGPEESIEAKSLVGEIHLNRGRVSLAEAAFDEAIKIAESIKLNARAARALGGLGEALFRAGRYSQAIARFKAAAQADPDELFAQLGLAKSSLQLERLEEARDMLVKLRKAHPKHMGVAYWYGRVQEALGDRKEAEVAYRDAIDAGKDDPEAVQSYIALASVQSQNGQLDAANATLADAQKHLPSSPALYKALGRVAMSQGRYADGYKEFQQALTADSEDVEAKFLLGTALVRQHEFDKALETFDAVAKIDRDFPGLALERGILFQESGRTEEALREYETALAKAPNDLDLILRVGCGKADVGAGVEAEKLLRKVLEQRQTSAETHFCLGRALMSRNVTDALKAFERAVQLDPNHAEYYLYIGWASNEAGNLTNAGNALKKALELDQGLADAYWQRGVLRLRQTRSKDAVDDLTKALELRPSRYEAHADLALAYNDLGKEDLALAEWQKAIAAKPTEPTWRFHYGKLLSLRLQAAAAAEQLTKAIELAEAQGGTFAWLSEAHRLAAMSLGNVPAAIPHWQAFLKNGAATSPYRNEAKAALKRLGQPWEED